MVGAPQRPRGRLRHDDCAWATRNETVTAAAQSAQEPPRRTRTSSSGGGTAAGEFAPLTAFAYASAS